MIYKISRKWYDSSFFYSFQGNMQGNGGIHDDEPELYSGSRCNTIYVDSTASSQLGATGHGSECESPLLVEKAEKKEIDQDPRPTDTLSYDKVENWLQFTCSANGLPSLSPYIPESSDSDHNDTLTLLNCVESARAIMEGRKKRRRVTNWWSRGGKVSNPLFHSILVEPLKILPGSLMYVMV